MENNQEGDDIPEEVTYDMVSRLTQEKKNVYPPPFHKLSHIDDRCSFSRKAETEVETLQASLEKSEKKIRQAKRNKEKSIKEFKTYNKKRARYRAWKEITDRYSRQESQALAQAIQTRLPREIRDLIYEQYWLPLKEDENGGLVRLNCTLFGLHFFPCDENAKDCLHNTAECSCFDNGDMFPTAMLAAYVGAQVAREACVTLTQLKTFSPSTFLCRDRCPHKNYTVQIEDLEELVERDFLRVGIPLRDVCVDNIKIWMNWRGKDLFGVDDDDDDALPPPARAVFNNVFNEYDCRRLRPLSRSKVAHVKQQLTSLLRFRFPTRLRVIFIFRFLEHQECYVCSYAEAERFFELFRDVYFELVERGCWQIYGIFGRDHEDGYTKYTLNPLRDYYRLPLAEYREKYNRHQCTEEEHENRVWEDEEGEEAENVGHGEETLLEEVSKIG
ncbi:hypothetical protein DM02DRAFT_625540 [Periconia macrospinosa]|uniref:Uncharacterized protein n=1 Tax=Periconia macrospinosa TaxID=97972 RepID=A0A2V1E0M0_9PLEO|nr:hypothetical protein DM02DRAFT_625540 [Periconia macrospinosa]